jgi:hypothetical protein
MVWLVWWEMGLLADCIVSALALSYTVFGLCVGFWLLIGILHFA